ncbi:MAG: sulfotransferase domain-containing protein [Mangrovicoccus sp.]|nr:sulfotransferase domain-containing protein [Mangrovicoccus sp.]
MGETNWLPNFIIAGAPKAGTSSLHAWIADHPDAFGSVEKETYFFVDPGTHMYRPDFHIAGGLESYKSQFPIPAGSAPKIILEATPGYMYYQLALEHIPALESNPKCLFILRDPAVQIYSLYTYFSSNWNWIPADMSFAEFLAAARDGSHEFKGNELARHAFSYGRYAEHLIPWREKLGEDRMMVLGFDDLLRDEVALIKKIAAWLGLDPSFYDTYDFPRENETYAPRNQALQGANIAVRGLLPKGKAYEFLRGIYRKLNTKKPEGASEEEKALIAELRKEFLPYNAQLSKEFGVDTSNWS